MAETHVRLAVLVDVRGLAERTRRLVEVEDTAAADVDVETDILLTSGEEGGEERIVSICFGFAGGERERKRDNSLSYFFMCWFAPPRLAGILFLSLSSLAQHIP